MSTSLSNHQLTALAATYGTPLYVYNANKITEQYQQLQQAFEGVDSRFFFACKALTNISILKHIRKLGCNIDCSSVNEAHLAIRAGFDPKNVLLQK